MIPAWAREVIAQYESGARSQFILHGNIHDRFVFASEKEIELGGLTDLLLKVLLPRFDVILSYDIGHGLRVERGAEIFDKWPSKQFPKAPRAAAEALSHYFRYTANLARAGGDRLKIACVIRDAHLAAPALPQGLNYDLNALAFLMRDWATDAMLLEHSLVTFLLAENLNDLHPLIVNSPRAARVKIPLPDPEPLDQAFGFMARTYPTALEPYLNDFSKISHALRGATLASIESLLKQKEHARAPLAAEDLAKLKKELVENDCSGLIEFMEPRRTLDALYGQEKIKTWLRQDIALWKANDIDALPKGYLLCGPVGTGKTFMVECLAGEAGVPVVKFKNFRDKWVGSTESNLEKIFRLLQALGRCYVFIDEADQALGKREGGSGDSGVSGRVYSMMAEEMSNHENRGKIIWVLATSRPDLVEVDLKRPGRIDVKIPLFPTMTAAESFHLIRVLAGRRKMEFSESDLEKVLEILPTLLTPGAAEALVVKTYRLVRTKSLSPIDALGECLKDYQPPVRAEIMKFQIEIAVNEASDLDFVPRELRPVL